MSRNAIWSATAIVCALSCAPAGVGRARTSQTQSHANEQTSALAPRSSLDGLTRSGDDGGAVSSSGTDGAIGRSSDVSGLEADAGTRSGREVFVREVVAGCPRDAAVPMFVDVNMLLKHPPRIGSRVRVVGRRREYLFESACRATTDTVATYTTFAPDAKSCAGANDLVVIDARVASAKDMLVEDGVLSVALEDARVVAYVSASVVCNYARQHPS